MGKKSRSKKERDFQIEPVSSWCVGCKRQVLESEKIDVIDEEGIELEKGDGMLSCPYCGGVLFSVKPYQG